MGGVPDWAWSLRAARQHIHGGWVVFALFKLIWPAAAMRERDLFEEYHGQVHLIVLAPTFRDTDKTTAENDCLFPCSRLSSASTASAPNSSCSRRSCQPSWRAAARRRKKPTLRG